MYGMHAFTVGGELLHMCIKMPTVGDKQVEPQRPCGEQWLLDSRDSGSDQAPILEFKFKDRRRQAVVSAITEQHASSGKGFSCDQT